MGKSKNNKFKVKTPQPTGLPSMKDAEAEENNELMQTPPTTAQTQTITLLEKLQSPDDGDRECGCSSIALSVFDKNMIPHLLENDVVKCIGPLLIDNNLAVRESAAGALRNLSVSGSHIICERMIQDDVMTPLVALIKQCNDNMKHESDKKKDSTVKIMTQAVHLLWNLCESSSVAVNIVNNENLVQIIMECLHINNYGMELGIPAAQCLHVVTEENSSAAHILSTPEMLSLLENNLMSSGITYQYSLLRVLVAGTLYNIRSSIPSSSQSCTLQAIVKVLSQTLDVDCIQAVGRLVSHLGAANGVNCSSSHEDTAAQMVTEATKDSKEAEEQINDIKCLVTSQQVALEITSNICVPDDDDDDDDWEEMDGTSSSSSSDDQADDMEVTENGTPIMSPLCLSAEIHTALIAQNVPKKVLDKTLFGDKDTLQAIASHPKTQSLLTGLQTIQNRALVCLQNMISVIDTESLGGNEALTKLWQTLLALALEKTATPTDEYIEAMTSALRALLQKMASNDQVPEGLSEEHLEALCELSRVSSNGNVRANIVGMLGSIGNLLAQKPDTDKLLTAIGNHLLDIISKDSELWVIAEALDAVFDTFGDGQSADNVAVQICLAGKLKQMLPVLKSKIRQGKRHLGDRYPVIMNARTNLIRFIKYKEEQAKR
ncbi:HEAT repeat-containing protein 3-like [Glandiceps talaboti]